MKNVMRSLLAVAAVTIACAGSAQAGFNFKIKFDGTTATQDTGSDTIVGASLNTGDTYSLNIRAAGNDYWRANSDASFAFGATFFVLPSSTRTANAITTFYLDGVQVAQISELGVSQSFVHIGNQIFSVTSGLMFDQVVVDYELLSSTAGGSTVIQDSPDIIDFNPFFRNSAIDYEVAPLEEVPAPPAVILGVIGVASLLGVGRFRRKPTPAVA